MALLEKENKQEKQILNMSNNKKNKLDPNIEKFLLEQKEKLKKKKKTKKQINTECDLKYWLVESSKKAGQMYLSTHVCKFSHPDGKTSPIIAKKQFAKDGYLRSGNVKNTKLDAYGNAAALAIYKFLNLEMEDGKTLLEHIEKNTVPPNVLGKDSLDIPYEKLRKGILKIKKQTELLVTSTKIKQVYFPVDKSYHQLSLLTPSGLISSMKKRINKIHFSEESKEARKSRNANEYSEKKYRQIYDLTIIGYGGTKPQNISILNSNYGGKFYLLPSWPPKLEKRKIRFPTKNFFQECLRPCSYKKSFFHLHRILSDEKSNKEIRQNRDKVILDIFYQILGQIKKIRQQGDFGWTDNKNYKNLPKNQKFILDEIYKQVRKNNTEAQEFLKETSRWVVISYKKVLKEKALDLYDIESRHFYDVLLEEGIEALL